MFLKLFFNTINRRQKENEGIFHQNHPKKPKQVTLSDTFFNAD